MITEEIVDIDMAIEPTEMLLKNMDKFPDVAQYVRDNNGEVPSFFFEEELISHEEWRRIFERKLYERLGLKINLSSPE